MKLTIRDIVKYAKWGDVKRAVRYHYPRDKGNYKELFLSLSNYKEAKAKPGDTLLVSGGLYCANKRKLDKFDLEFLDRLKTGDESLYYSIHIKKKGEKYTYSCSFVPWLEMANMPIDKETLRLFTFADIIAHFIWEITFYGDEKEMNKKGKMLLKAVEEIKDGKVKLIPADKAMEKIIKKGGTKPPKTKK